MHEMALAESVMEIISAAAAAQNFRRVKTITLEIGQLAAVEADALRFCLEAVTRDTLAENAKVEIIETAGMGRCRDCGKNVLMPEKYGFCSACGSAQLNITAGDKMRVKHLSVE